METNNIVIGTAWGDEGKGRVISALSKEADAAVRSTGGNNAGHTVYPNGKKVVLHLVPEGLARGTKSFITEGVLVNPEVLLEDIKALRDCGVTVNEKVLRISGCAHVIFPHHMEADVCTDEIKTNPVGTTKKGIGPCQMDKVNRIGCRMFDLLLPAEELAKKMTDSIEFWNKIFNSTPGYEAQVVTDEEKLRIAKKYHEYGEILKAYICDTQPEIQKIVDAGGNVLYGGAQSFFLDVDHGNYPYVTSTNPNPSGTLSAAGAGPSAQYNVIGVVKAHTSRVGNGPFPTERNDDWADYVRTLAHEYGATTGRPRRVGPLDLVLINTCKGPAGLTELALNHFDTMGRIGEKFGKIEICYAYSYKSEKISYFPKNLSVTDSKEIIPLYKQFNGGWNISSDIRSFEELPPLAKEVIKFIETVTGLTVKYIGIGPGNEDMIVR